MCQHAQMTRIQARVRMRMAWGVASAASAGVGVELSGPGRGVAAVVGEGREGLAGAGVGGPSEVDGSPFAGLLGDGAGSDLGAGAFDIAPSVTEERNQPWLMPLEEWWTNELGGPPPFARPTPAQRAASTVQEGDRISAVTGPRVLKISRTASSRSPPSAVSGQEPVERSRPPCTGGWVKATIPGVVRRPACC